MKFDPKTPEEEMKLYQALTNGANYDIEIKLVATIIDEEEIIRQAVEKVESAKFDNEDGRIRVLENMRADLAEAIGILLTPEDVITAGGGIACRSASFTVRLRENRQ
jgi:hypothetical protein